MAQINDLAALLAADLNDAGTRLVLADALEEAGCTDEMALALCRSATVALRLWVENQPDGAGHDGTEEYLDAADLPRLPAGVTREGATLSGPPAAAWTALVALRAAVADAGHGEVSDEAADELGEPSLVAHPAGWEEDGYTPATVILARMVSQLAPTWGAFLREMLRGAG